MGEEIAFENGQISDFHGLVTLTLDRVILHTVMHHLSTSTYIPNFIEIKETFCGQMEGRMYVQTDGHLRYTNVMRSTRRSRSTQRSPSNNGDNRHHRHDSNNQITANHNFTLNND